MWRRRLFVMFSLLSLAGMLLVGWLWYNSYARSYELRWLITKPPRSAACIIETGQGAVAIVRATVLFGPSNESPSRFRFRRLARGIFSRPITVQSLWFPGFYADNLFAFVSFGSGGVGQLHIPFWFLLIAAGVLPLRGCWLLRGRWRRERRRRLGRCAK